MPASGLTNMPTDFSHDCRALRVGAVGYLNSKPLVEGLETLLPHATVKYDAPASLAQRMKSGEFDIGLIPVVEFLTWEAATYIGGLAVACSGPVGSVCVHSRVPFNQVRTMALDEGSRTSIALMHVLFRENGWDSGKTCPFPLDKNPMDSKEDAILLIGDRAMAAGLDGYSHRLDLGEEWHRLTGLPFVFALWAVRPGLGLTEKEIGAFHAALALGRSHVAEIARREAEALGLDTKSCIHYLTHNIRFDLGELELRGLSVFQKKLKTSGLITGRDIHEVHRLDTWGNR